jgi:hypothetical protein
MRAAPLRANGQSEQGGDSRNRSQALHGAILRLIGWLVCGELCNGRSSTLATGP